MFKQTRLSILLSLNAVAIVIAGILIANAIGLNKGIEFRVVGERSDVTTEAATPVGLLQSGGAAQFSAPATDAVNYDPAIYGDPSTGGISQTSVPNGELWNESEVTMYQTADFDLCVGGNLSDLGDMYWQTSNSSVISGFYSTARTWLGYNSETCKFPIIKNTGTTTITAGTYDGTRHDTITVNVVAPPYDQWKQDVLELVNKERTANGLSLMNWGTTCEGAANLRAREIVTEYSHTRPDGSEWSTACPIPTSGGKSGENLNAGNAAVTPKTTVISWMNSPDHRANILNPEYTRLSVGIVYDPESQYKTYWSQFFATY